MFHIWKCDQTFVVTDIDLELCAYRIELFFLKKENLWLQLPPVRAPIGSFFFI